MFLFFGGKLFLKKGTFEARSRCIKDERRGWSARPRHSKHARWNFSCTRRPTRSVLDANKKSRLWRDKDRRILVDSPRLETFRYIYIYSPTNNISKISYFSCICCVCFFKLSCVFFRIFIVLIYIYTVSTLSIRWMAAFLYIYIHTCHFECTFSINAQTYRYYKTDRVTGLSTHLSHSSRRVSIFFFF